MSDDPRELPGLLTPEATLHRLADDLATRFAGIFARETVDRYVFESYTALAQAKGAVSHDVPRCCSSACRTPAAPRWPPAC